MTVQELIEILEDSNPDAEVRFASQPSWPFEYSIADVHVGEVSTEPNEDNCPNEGDCDKCPLQHPPCENTDDMAEGAIVYLVEGSQLGYLPGNVKNEIGW